MLCQQEVLARLESIRQEENPPLRKIRRLLRLRKDVGQTAAKMATGCAILRGDGEDEGANRIETRMRELLDACEIARTTAADVAREAKQRPQARML